MFRQGKGEKALAFCSMGKGKFAKGGQGNKEPFATQRLSVFSSLEQDTPAAAEPPSKPHARYTRHRAPSTTCFPHGGSLPQNHPPAGAKAPERHHTPRAITYKPSHPSARWCRQHLCGRLAPLLGSTGSRPTPGLSRGSSQPTRVPGQERREEAPKPAPTASEGIN